MYAFLVFSNGWFVICEGLYGMDALSIVITAFLYFSWMGGLYSK